MSSELAKARCRRGRWQISRQPLPVCFAAINGNNLCLVLPSVSTHPVSVFLRGFPRQPAPDVHAVLVLDGAGWHFAAALSAPNNITLVKLPPDAPELNPVERIWLYRRECFLSHRLHADQEP